MTVVRRPPGATYVKAEGALGHWGEYASTTLDDVWGRLEKFYQDRQGVDSTELDELAERFVNRTDLNTAARKITLADPVHLPWTDYQPGDIVTLNLAPKDVKRELRVAAITVSMGPSDAAPKYDVHFGAPVLSNEAAMAQGLRTLIREFRRPTSAGATVDGQPTVPIPPPTTGTAIEDASWVFAASDSTAADQIRGDEVCSGTADQTTITNSILTNLPDGGTVGFLPGTYYFDGPLTNSDASGNQVNLLFGKDLRLRGSPGTVFTYASNPGASAYLVRFGDTAADITRTIFDGIQFDGQTFANVEGVQQTIGVGSMPHVLYEGCTFSNFHGDYLIWGERDFHLNVSNCFFYNCQPDVSFFHLGGFSDGDVQIHDFSMIGCTGTLWSGAGFSLGGMIYNWNSDAAITVPIDSLVPVYHYRNGPGTYTAGDHASSTGTVLNTVADTKGDILAATANDTWDNFPAGTNNYALFADSSQTFGLQWRNTDRTLAVNVTAVGNVTTGEDDLQSYTVPAATLAATGDHLTFTAAGTFAATANNKRIRVKYGASTLYDTGALAITAASDWSLDATIIRTGAATQKCVVRFVASDAGVADSTDYSTAAETLSGTVVLKLTGEATATDDVVEEMSTVRFVPAP